MNNSVKISVEFADDKKKITLTKKTIKHVIKSIVDNEKVNAVSIYAVLVDSKRIHELNKQFLEHDYPTDVIVFSLNEPDEPLEGEIYVCTDVAEFQAKEYNVSFNNEILRLIIHGTLHLSGYNDNTDDEKKFMLSLGETYLNELFEDNQ